MKIAISGSTGLIGSALKDYFLKGGNQVIDISRQKFHEKPGVHWDIKKDQIDVPALEGQDVIIHLAGANISSKNWSAAYKREIKESRIKSTKLLVHAIKNLNQRPKIIFCASAIGYYGDQGPKITITERSLSGDGFLAEVCREWENACAELILYGVRLIHMRFGVVLSKKSGALAKMLPIFNLGLGGRLGSGRQMMSWIALDEIPSIVDFVINHPNVGGAINFVSPQPVSNSEFTKTLGRVIHRPTILPVPKLVIKSLMGQMGKELLLDGAQVIPQVLLDAGYQFQYPNLENTLKHYV